MIFLYNLKVSVKLGILILVALLSLGAVGYTGYYYLQEASKAMNIMYAERLVPIELLNQTATGVRTINEAVLGMMLTSDVNKNRELKTLIEQTMTKVGENLTAVEKLPLDTKAADLLAKVRTSRQQYHTARTEVTELAMQNKNAEAFTLYVTKVEPLTREYNSNLLNLIDYYHKLCEEMNLSNQASAAWATRITIVFTLTMVVLLSLGGLFLSRMITSPLQIMVSTCKRLADGDFRDKPHQMMGKDEIGQLAAALTNLRASLSTVLKQVNESAEQVAASSEELTASAQQSAQAVTQVAGSINDVAQGAEKQLKAVDETSAVVEQMSAGIQQVAASANQVAANSSQAAEKAKEGDQSVEKAVSQMNQIEQTVSISAQVVAKLGERSKEIGQIVDTISGIAGQTNLLALNAAIEAARAGEQGRGFAVVAEEVRKLAEQSRDAAKQISTLITEIQGDTNKAVIAMEEGTREVKVGTEVVTAAGQAFKEITALVTHVSEQVKEASSAMQQMASDSQHIVGAVNEIDGHSKMAASQAQMVSAATEEQSACIEEIASSSQNLANLAQNLQAAVNHFKV